MTKSNCSLPNTIFLLGAGVCLVLTVAWFLLTRPSGLTDLQARQINFTNFQRITIGMTEREVNEILGVPPGDYRTVPGFNLVGPGHIRLAEDDDATGAKLKI